MTTYRQYRKALESKSNKTTRRTRSTTATTAKPRQNWKLKTAEEATAERDEKIKAAQEKLKKGLEELKGKEGLKKHLLFLSKFHNYSFKNTILLYEQAKERAETVSYFNSFKRWTDEFHRTVKKGSKAYYVYAPLWIGTKSTKVKTTDPATGEETEETKKEVYIRPDWINRYKLVPIFSYEQTEGEPLPPDPWSLPESGERYRSLVTKLEAVAPVIVEELTVWTDDSKGYYWQTNTANIVNPEAYTRPIEGIKINANAADLDKLATLVHEIAHSIADWKQNPNQDERQIKEIRADSTAFVVLNALGIDTKDMNFIYLESWSGGDYDKIYKLGNDVQTLAHLILSAIETGQKISRDSWKAYAIRRKGETEATETAPETTAANALPVDTQEPQEATQDAPRTRSFFPDYEPEAEPETAQETAEETETAEDTPRRFSPLMKLEGESGDYELASFDRETGEKVSILTYHEEELEEVPF